MKTSTSTTPMMKQFWAIKKNHPDAILFYRMGDFYEMFGDDAVTASKVMNIALTTRDKASANPIPMCGVPYHALSNYLPKMISKGYKVAICEQVEDPRVAVGVVKREVIRVVTPGTVTEPSLLEDKSFNFLAAVAPGKRGFGLAVADLSTGLFRVCELIGERSLLDLEYELDKTCPKQILIPDNLEESHPPLSRALALQYGAILDKLDAWTFGFDNARQAILTQFNVASLDGFGLQSMEQAVRAAGAAISYLRDTQKSSVGQISKIVIHNPSDTMPLDPATSRNLELTRNLADSSPQGTLLSVLDDTKTAMGGRELKEWLLRPLVRAGAICDRLSVVKSLHDDNQLLDAIQDKLSEMGDLERIAGRVTVKTCSPRDLLSLSMSLKPLPQLRELVEGIGASKAKSWMDRWDDLKGLNDYLSRAVSDEPPAHMRDGGAIRPGFSKQLDKLKALQSNSRKLLVQLEEDEKAKTGLTGLKVKYNKVYGYFIEISRRHASSVPDDWMRKQSLVNTERYVSPRLKQLEEKILSATEEAMKLELKLFEEVRAEAAAHAKRAQAMAAIIGELDALSSLSSVAVSNNYVEPVIDEGDDIEIKGGRHPILELAGLDERFVPNDALFDLDTGKLQIITGPNMAGKSTYIRQVAIITLMAQTGSFVPADSARIGLADRIFTRVGAQDHLQKGQSTFMVEMNETALILNNATSRSLIILDEIGRGTSTFDGISIAWAVAEYIHKVGARTLFATHYHELTELADSLSGVRNLSVAVKEWDDEIVFLRKIVEGGADKSYGIQVARLAGLPAEVIKRAGEILIQYETNQLDSSGHPKLKAKEAEGQAGPQADLFTANVSEVEQELEKIDIENLTPLEALNRLSELKKKL